MDRTTQPHIPAIPEARLVPFKEARSLVGISRSKIYLLLADGAFPRPVKIGRCIYFSSFELQQWIAAQLQSRNEGLSS